jgi:proline dehydrogenase
MEEIEERIITLRKQLESAKRVCELTYRYSKLAEEKFNNAKEVYQNDLKRYEDLDRQLAELDGRLKVIKAGESGKVKKLKVPNLTPDQAKNLLGKLKGMMKK